MANTYTLISSSVLSSTQASVTFSAIPNTYTDLCLRVSARGDSTSHTLYLKFNASTGNPYSSLSLYSNGSNAGTLSTYYNDDSELEFIYGTERSDATSNMFSNSEIYIPNYNVAANKPVNGATTMEDNISSGSTTGRATHAGLWRSTAAITEIRVRYAGNFIAGSSFYLYGIKNS